MRKCDAGSLSPPLFSGGRGVEWGGLGVFVGQGRLPSAQDTRVAALSGKALVW